MQLAERDRMVLSILEADRADIEEVIDDVVVEALPSAEPPYLLAAAESFDARAEDLPDDEKLVAWQIAAILRERANPSPPN